MLENWGCPYHGTISGGLLTLPNGSTMDCAEPVSWPGDNAGYGNTLLQRMPWAPGAERTPEQAASDLQKGRQWLDYALLSGLYQNLHGSVIGGWIYAAPDNRPWLIDAQQIRSYSGQSSWIKALKMTRFGRAGGSGGVRSFTLELANTGQSTPSLTGAVYAELADITPDGSKAIVAIYLKPSQPAGGFVARHPIGFWLIELSGTPGVDFAASVSVLKTREQTIGVASDTGAIPATPATYEIRGTVNESPSPGTSTIAWADSGSTSYNQFYGEREWRIDGKVAAMWFDSSGVPQPVTVTIERTWEANIGPITSTHTGLLTITSQGGSNSYSGELVQNIKRNGMSRSTTRTVTATFMGQSISASVTKAESGSYDYRWTLAGPTPEQVVTDDSTAVITSSVGIEQADSSLGRNPSPGDTSLGTSPQEVATALGDDPWFSVGSGSAAVAVTVGLWQYSNNLISVITQTGAYDAQNSKYDWTWHNGSSLTPLGVVSGSDTAPAAARYGSWNPGTGEVVRAQSNPICWT